MSKPKILVFASGSAEGGGSGFENLVKASRDGRLEAEIAGVVSNHKEGGVRELARKFGVEFIHFTKPWDASRYQSIATYSEANFFVLSGWLKKVVGLDLKTNFNPKTVFNIHPAPLPRFGGQGMYGKHIHEAVIAAFSRGEITHSAISMHFVTEDYDLGPVFFEMKVKIFEKDNAETLGSRLRILEHFYQPKITNMVAKGLISWDGVNPSSLKLPKSF